MAYKEGSNPVADPVKVAPGVKMFAEVVGRGKPMVLVHGFGLNHRMWEYQIPYLKRHGYHVVSIDLRGFGDSKNMPASYTYKTWAKDFGKAIVKFERRDVTLVGYSLGGAIAMHYIAAHDDPPLERLALVAAAGPYMTWSKEGVLDRLAEIGLGSVTGLAEAADAALDFRFVDALDALCGTGEVLTGETLHAVRDILSHWACVGRDPVFFDTLIAFIATGAFPQLISQIYGDEVRRADLQWIEDMLQSNSPEALVGALKEMRNQDLQESLEDIAVPTTIVGGTMEILVPPWLIAEQLMQIEDAEYSMVLAGHGLFFEQIDALNQALAGW
jgi:pimeloyl-ACP methyl ester carboxylesterase